MRCSRRGMVSKFNLGEVERSILSNILRQQFLASWTIFIKKTVLWFSAGRVWSAGFPLWALTPNTTRRWTNVGHPIYSKQRERDIILTFSRRVLVLGVVRIGGAARQDVKERRESRRGGRVREDVIKRREESRR